MVLRRGTIGYKIFKRATNKDYLRGVAHQFLFDDRRLRPADLSKVKPEVRKAKSTIINFYSGTNNIGDLIPVLGISRMLDHTPDVWSMLDRNIDFDFVNRNYSKVIIGGAGLFDINFLPFWRKLLNECHLPIAIWGVGITADVTSKDYIQIVSQVAQRCDLINVRDSLTAEIFDLDSPSITACPSLIYLQEYIERVDRNSTTLLYSSHERSIARREKKQIKAEIAKIVPDYLFTDHMQYSFLGLEQIIGDYYCQSSFVVTTRLHGAIIAYGLGIPYLAINRAPKTSSFVSEYGNGLMTDNPQEIGEIIKDRFKITADLNFKPVALQPIIDFGERVKEWSEFKVFVGQN